MTDTAPTPSFFEYDSSLQYDANTPYDAYAPVPTTVPTSVLPHLGASLTLNGDGSFAFLQQDTLDDVSQCVEMVCGTPAGQRNMIPTFGVQDPTFTYPTDTNAILQAIHTWEPRASAQVNVSYNDQGQANVRVSVALVRGTTS